MSTPRVLVVRVGALGDVLHALPAVAALREQLPAATIDWVVDTRWEPLLVDEGGAGPMVDHAFPAETRLWSRKPFSRATAQSVAALRHALRQTPYDAVVDMQGTLRSAVLGRMARSPVFAGFQDPRERAAALLYRHRLQRQGTHVVEQGAALLGEALHRQLTPRQPPLPRSTTAEVWAQRFLDHLPGQQRTALLAPTAGWGAKEWPVAHFAELARALRDGGWRVLINAPEGGSATTTALAETSSGAAIPAPCSVAQLIALVRHSDVVIGGDSGPVHLAATLGTPVVGLYGPTDPARNGPWGPGAVEVLRSPLSKTSYKRNAATDAGLRSLSPADVLAAVQRVAGSNAGT